MRSAPGPGFCWPRQRSRSPSSAAVLSTTASARCSTWRVLRSGYSVSSSASTCSRPKDSSRLVPKEPEAYEHFVAEGSGVREARRVLAYWNREIWEGNQKVIDRMLGSFRWACLALVGSVLVWSVGLALQ